MCCLTKKLLYTGGAALGGVLALFAGVIAEAGNSGSSDRTQEGGQNGVSVLPPLQGTLSQTGSYPVRSPGDSSFSAQGTVRSREATSSSASPGTTARRTSLATGELREVSSGFQSEDADRDGCKSAGDLEIIEGSFFFSPGNSDRFPGSARPSTRFYEILFFCGRSSFGNEEKTARCVQDYLWAEAHRRLSDSCMRCFSRSVGCGAANCKGPCFFSSCAAACLECSEESCSGDLLRCSGLPRLPEPCVPDMLTGVFAEAR